MKEFNDLYKNVLLNDLKSLDRLRINLLIALSIIASMFILYISFLIDLIDNSLFIRYRVIIDIIIILCLLLAVSIKAYFTLFFIRKFKEKVIKKIINYINPNLEYNSQGFIDKNDFLNSNFPVTEPNTYSGNDLVYGSVGKTSIQFSDIKAEYKEENSELEVFKGIFFIADFNKKFSGQTLILPDYEEYLLGFIAKHIQSLDSSYGKLVNLDNPEFEQLFKVYSDNQVTSRYILSTSLMKRIVDLKNSINPDIYISFKNSKMYIALPIAHDLFEPNLYKSLLDYNLIEEYYNYLQFLIGIVDELNLNTRIWA